MRIQRKKMTKGIPVLPQLYDLFYSGDIGTKLEVAGRLFLLHGEELGQDWQVAAGMTDLCGRHEALRQQMLVMEMDRICTRCAQGSGGGCCSVAFAAETDVAQLLMNMLAGVVVDIQQSNGTDCCYLGEKGCIFLFKPMFCLNYNCSIITLGGQSDNLRKLEKQTGMLLRAQQDMENRMIDFFKKKALAADENNRIFELPVRKKPLQGMRTTLHKN
jgi:hypothetical protein